VAQELEVFAFERPVFGVDFTPDGAGAVVRVGSATVGEGDLAYVDLSTGTVDATLLDSPYNEFAVSLSPDGRWMTYVSDVSGRPEVFVRPFENRAGARTQISTEGGVSPVWAHSGRELFFISSADAAVWAAALDTDGELRVVGRRMHFPVGRRVFTPDSNGRFFDVSSDDQRFVFPSSRDGPRATTPPRRTASS